MLELRTDDDTLYAAHPAAPRDPDPHGSLTRADLTAFATGLGFRTLAPRKSGVMAASLATGWPRWLPILNRYA